MLLRALLALVVPALLLAVAEFLLRVVGYGYPTTFFVKTHDGKALTTNRRFAWRFMSRANATQPVPAFFTTEKPRGTFRIFVLGESAAQGTPAPAFGFARILEVMLERQFPERRFEIINAAMRGINSHALVPIAKECARLSPDLFLVYLGNNETVGLYAPEPEAFNLAAHPQLIRVMQGAKRLRLAQLVESGARRWRGTASPRPAQDMAFFRSQRLAFDDPRRVPVYENFRRNLLEICGAARAANAKAIVSTLAVNVTAFPPLASLHRAGLSGADLAEWEAAFKKGTEAEAAGQFTVALTNYAEAARLDDHFAELHFRLAACHEATGNRESARRHFLLARDWDALQFRADGRQNDLVREVALSMRDLGLELLDADRIFAEAGQGDHPAPASLLFHEHVHFKFDGDYLLARSFLPLVVKSLGLAGGATKDLASRQECAAALAFTEWDSISVDSAMARMTARPPFLDQADHARRQAQKEHDLQQRLQLFQQQDGFRRASEGYRAALERRPKDWQLHFNLGCLRNDFGDKTNAVPAYLTAVNLMPEALPLRIGLAQALWDTGQKDSALAHLNEALRLDPEFSPAKEALGQVAGRRAR